MMLSMVASSAAWAVGKQGSIARIKRQARRRLFIKFSLSVNKRIRVIQGIFYTFAYKKSIKNRRAAKNSAPVWLIR
jgi:hypothetical protein